MQFGLNKHLQFFSKTSLIYSKLHSKSCDYLYKLYQECKKHILTSNELNKDERKRKYASGIIEVENGTFTPLVFTTTGGMSQECQRYHSRLAELISSKKQENYATAITWIKTKVSFAIPCPCLFERNKVTEKKDKCTGEWLKDREETCWTDIMIS